MIISKPTSHFQGNGICCLYHDDADGFASALVVWRYCQLHFLPFQAQAMQYGDPVPLDQMTDKDIVIVDFSFPPQGYDHIRQVAASFVVIDHHPKSAWLADAPFGVYAADKSGAVLTWEYFHPGYEVPELLAYVQEYDLHQWRLPFSREIGAAINSYAFDFQQWYEWLKQGLPASMKTEGVALLRYQQKEIDRILTHVEYRDIAGYEHIPFINSACYKNELGERLAADAPFAVIWFEIPGKRCHALRSRSDGVDVREIAEQFGGGGHPHAAGFAEML